MSYLVELDGKTCDCDDTHNEGPRYIKIDTTEVGDWKTCAYCGTTLLDLSEKAKADLKSRESER